MAKKGRIPYTKEINKMHGAYSDKRIIATLGASEFLSDPAYGMYENNPLTDTGKKIKRNMKATYGAKKGQDVFYGSIQKGNQEHQSGTNNRKKGG